MSIQIQPSYFTEKNRANVNNNCNDKHQNLNIQKKLKLKLNSTTKDLKILTTIN